MHSFFSLSVDAESLGDLLVLVLTLIGLVVLVCGWI
jgi:hypothetical protein